MLHRAISNKGEKSLYPIVSVLVVAAVVFVVSFPNLVVASEGVATLSGDIVGLDSYGKMLTVKATGSAESSSSGAGGLFTFAYDRMTNIIWCTQNKTFNWVNIGDRVTVTYHEKDGKLVADAVDIAPVLLACYYDQ